MEKMQKELSKELLDILACPSCKGQVVKILNENKLSCKKCSNTYQIKNGIPIMLIPK